MTREQEHKVALASFLDRQYRQVWAVHRQTGERVFLDWGEATPEMRDHAKSNLKCPVPGCELRISARGRTKRDHFFHLGRPGHGEGEGEWHLQAKALLADWANQQAGVVAQEEETIYVESGARHRRADVMATWPATGVRVALEVEYKDYTPEGWSAKQADYDGVRVGCTWVFGHLPRYLRQPRKPADLPDDAVWDRLQWVELTAAVARAGRPIVFINPVERAVVTAVQHQAPLAHAEGDRDWWRYTEQVGTTLAHPDCHREPVLVLDPLDTCHLDPERGLITPTMTRIAAERQVINERARAAKAEAEARADRKAQRQAQAIQDREARRAFAQQKAIEDAETWDNSALRKHLVERYGGRLPNFLICGLSNDRGVYAHPVHWHSQLFYDLVLGTGSAPMIGRTVTIRQVYAMIGQQFRMSHQASLRANAISDYLHHLQLNDVLDFDTEDDGTIGPITVISDGKVPPDVAAARERQAQRDEAEAEAQREVAQERAARVAVERQRLDALRHEAEQRFADERAARETAEQRRDTEWRSSSLHATITAAFGNVPLPIKWTGGTEATAIDVHPAHWHAQVYMTFIHQRPTGHQFTALDAVAILEHHHIPFVGGVDAASKAVAAYLFNLGQRGILRRLPDEDAESAHALQTVIAPLPPVRLRAREVGTDDPWQQESLFC
jgi:hypothetical protein